MADQRRPILALNRVTRSFRQGRSRLDVLKGVDLELKEGELVALVGPSGSGKSTLLQVAGLLEPPDGGAISIVGQPAEGLGDDDRAELRLRHLGFVYQYHHLLPEFSAIENVIIPQMIAGLPKREARRRAAEMLDMLGLGERMTHRPARLSGGEQQRVAIARAIANVPDLLLADEPTGNLDPDTAAEVFRILVRIARGTGLAAVVATHNPELAKSLDRTFRMEDGHLVPA
ncbi:MAG: ABC transporter ATP-binding protein [Rhodospirillales bacterium]